VRKMRPTHRGRTTCRDALGVDVHRACQTCANPTGQTSRLKIRKINLLKLRDLVLFLVAALVLVVDQWSKAWALQNIPINTTYDFLPPLGTLFVLTHITNSGAAFGLFPQMGIIFTFVAVIVSFAIVWYQRSIPAGQWLVRLSLGMQLGGALGNLIDRLQFGAVTDIFYFRFFSPVFNFADSSIVVGVALLMWHLMRNAPKDEAAKPLETPEAKSD
jgi:signal peptidase II